MTKDRRAPKMKTLIVSETVPPMVQGPAVMLANLLKTFPKGSYCILTKDMNWRGQTDESSRLPCPYFYVDRAYSSFKTRLHSIFSQLLEQVWILRIVLKGLKVIKRERIDNILAFSNEGDMLIASYILHKITKLPLSLYMLDVYEEMVRLRVRKVMARIFEKRIFGAADRVFVMSENLKAHYLKKYNLQTEFMPHPVVLSDYQGPVDNNDTNGDKVVLYTGNVWIPQIESLVAMCNVVNSMEGIKFVVYTDRSAEELKGKEIYGRNVVVRFARHSQIPEIQRKADILYLPLAFNSPFPLMIETASPGKMPEYLAAGRPILVYAPDYSYIAQHARRHGFGLVVDRQCEEGLKEGLMSLLDDDKISDDCVHNARKLSRSHDAFIVSRRLLEALSCG